MALSPLQLTTPLGDGKLLLQTFQAEERISGLFHYSLEMVSTDNALDFTQIVGKAVTVSTALVTGETEYFNGIVGTVTMVVSVVLTLYSLALYLRRYAGVFFA